MKLRYTLTDGLPMTQEILDSFKDKEFEKVVLSDNRVIKVYMEEKGLFTVCIQSTTEDNINKYTITHPCNEKQTIEYLSKIIEKSKAIRTLRNIKERGKIKDNKKEQ